jgi:hypothetical protein
MMMIMKIMIGMMISERRMIMIMIVTVMRRIMMMMMIMIGMRMRMIEIVMMIVMVRMMMRRRRTIRWNGYAVFMIHDDEIIHACTGRKQSRKLGRYKMDLIYRIQPSSRYVHYLIVASPTYLWLFGA